MCDDADASRICVLKQIKTSLYLLQQSGTHYSGSLRHVSINLFTEKQQEHKWNSLFKHEHETHWHVLANFVIESVPL